MQTSLSLSLGLGAEPGAGGRFEAGAPSGEALRFWKPGFSIHLHRQPPRQHREEPLGLLLHVKPVSSPHFAIRIESEREGGEAVRGGGRRVTSAVCLAGAIHWLAKGNILGLGMALDSEQRWQGMPSFHNPCLCRIPAIGFPSLLGGFHSAITTN